MSPQSDVAQLEKQLKIEDLTMYTMIHTRELRERLGESCSSEDIADAQSLVKTGLARLDRKYAGMSDAEVLRHSWNFYEQLREKHGSKADKV
jgi:hypothetical protein